MREMFLRMSYGVLINLFNCEVRDCGTDLFFWLIQKIGEKQVFYNLDKCFHLWVIQEDENYSFFSPLMI